MTRQLCYQIRNWEEIYETPETRKRKELKWVPVPNRFDGDAVRRLITCHPSGSAHYGAWCAILLVASRCRPRGKLIKDDGTPHTEETLALRTGIDASILREALERLCDARIGWVERKAAGKSARRANNTGAVAEKSGSNRIEDLSSPKTPKKDPEGKGRGPRARELPTDYKLTPELTDYIARLGLDPAGILEDVCDHFCRIKPGQKRTEDGWRATIQGWARREAAKRESPRRRPSTPRESGRKPERKAPRPITTEEAGLFARAERARVTAGDPWAKALKALEASVHRGTFDTWLRPARFLGVDGAKVFIGVPNGLFLSRLQADDVAGEIRRALGSDPAIVSRERFELWKKTEKPNASC